MFLAGIQAILQIVPPYNLTVVDIDLNEYKNLTYSTRDRNKGKKIIGSIYTAQIPLNQHSMLQKSYAHQKSKGGPAGRPTPRIKLR